MSERMRFFLLIGIFVIFILSITGITVGLLYSTAMREERLRLTETAQSQARLIEAVSRFDETYNSEFPGGAQAASLSQITDAHEAYRGFGETGEFTLAHLSEGMIIFLLSHRHSEMQDPEPVPFDSTWAEPMRRALSGLSGTVLGLDYRGVRVLAAYEPVQGLDLGIVVKIDLSEIQAPFVTAGAISAIAAASLVILGAVLFTWITTPVWRELERGRNDWQETFDSMSDWLSLVDSRDRTILRSNSTCEVLLGVPAEQVIGRVCCEFVHGSTEPLPGCPITKMLETGKQESLEYQLPDEERWCLVTADPVTDTDGNIIAAVHAVRDITHRKQAEEALKESDKRFRTVFEASPLPINMADSEGRLVLTNTAFQELLGYSAIELSDMTFRDIIHPEDRKADSEAFQKTMAEHHSEYTIQQRYVHKSGKSIPVDVAVSAVLSPTGDFQYGFAIARDLTQQQEHEEQLAILARHDPLTGVYNRHALDDMIEQEVRRSRRYKHPIGLLMVDVNRFKEVNDRFGHAMGDQVLKTVAEILQHHLRDSDFVVRYGGDEFLVVLLETDGETAVVVGRIRAEVAERNKTNPLLDFPVTLAIGEAHWDPQGPDTIDSILSRADQLMYDDKAGSHEAGPPS